MLPFFENSTDLIVCVGIERFLKASHIFQILSLSTERLGVICDGKRCENFTAYRTSGSVYCRID